MYEALEVQGLVTCSLSLASGVQPAFTEGASSRHISVVACMFWGLTSEVCGGGMAEIPVDVDELGVREQPKEGAGHALSRSLSLARSLSHSRALSRALSHSFSLCATTCGRR